MSPQGKHRRPLVERIRRFWREYTEGLSRREIRHLFDRDATQAFSVLTDTQKLRGKQDLSPTVILGLVISTFRGLAFKLSPARRLLFGGALLAPFLGLVDLSTRIGPTEIHLDFEPFWFLVSIGGLTFLLALELVDRVRVRDELQVARELQEELLPQRIVVPPGYRVAHSYRTANEIGGDYYEFIPLEGGRLAIAVGDASGHGMAAGLLMAIASASLKTAVDLDPRPEAVLDLLNRSLYRTGGRRAFMSFFYALLDPATGTLTFADAGHPFPLLRRRDGQVEELGRGALPLGLRPAIEVEVSQTSLGHGETLVLYSDGLPEALASKSGEDFGFERLHELLAPGGEPGGLHDRILSAFDHFRGEEPLADDFTLVVLGRTKYAGEPRPRENPVGPPSGE